MNNQLQSLDDLLVTLDTDEQLLAVARMRQTILIDIPDDQPRIYADELPPMQPVDGKRWATIDVSCPVCKAKPGKPCLLMTRGGGANSTVLDPPQPKSGFHSKRRARAKGRQ